jgi:hypothetical protein
MLPFSDPRLGFGMSHHPTLHLDRRSLLIKAAVTSASVIIPQSLGAAELVPTPGQTEGPFYPVEFPLIWTMTWSESQARPLRRWVR